MMQDDIPLYNSRIIKNYFEYLGKYYPDLSKEEILSYGEMNNYEVDDPGHWFNQRQIDRFQDILMIKTGNPTIYREVGRYLTSSEGLGPVRQHMLGLMNPMSVYMLMGKIYTMVSRGAEVHTRKLGPTSVEIVSTPKPGVKERKFQCENRLGSFESLAKLFTKGFAQIEHPSCFHNGDENCRYIITWEKTPSLLWKRIRNYSILSSAIAGGSAYFLTSLSTWGIVTVSLVIVNIALSFIYNHLEKRELIKTIETQGNVAEDLFEEMNIRHNNAMLIQEIGQATSTILNIDDLIHEVVAIMEKRLDFDRGMILLANESKKRLIYSAGYGYSQEQQGLLQQTSFHLDKPTSKGIFALTFKEQKSFIINGISEIKNDLSKRSLEFAEQMGVQALICLPIVYEKEALGVLAVDNVKSKRPITQSDKSLLTGVASQTAVSFVNAQSFQKLSNSEKKYRDLVENANSIILRRDIKGKITFFNEYAQKLFGYREEEIIGENIIGAILPDSGPTRRQIANLNASLQMYPDLPQVSEDKNILRDKSHVWIAWTYKPIFDEDNEIREILCIGNDVTKLKEAELEKKDLENRLIRAEKMEALGTLAGGVAHDLNNILSGIVSYPELLLMGLPEDSPFKKPVMTIQKSGEKAAAIVQDLLTLARRGVVGKKVINLNDIIKEYLASPEHNRLAENHPDVKVITRLDDDALNIQGSPVHLSKTVMNLVTNAAEAMPKGGVITITTENRYVDWPIGGYDQVEKGDYVTLKISDTGIGIPNTDIDRIFEPFYTKKVMGRSGTGLGMAVVWGSVKDHDGYIDVNSKQGEGATFTLYLPVTRQQTEDEIGAVSLESYKGQGETVLIIDDAPEQQEIASKILEKLGYRVSSVSGGEEAIAYLKTHAVDLLLLDMIMEPGIDGYETYKRILEIHPGQKAVIASGFSETERVKAAQKLGAGTYVKKPYKMEIIGKAAKKELNNK